MFLQKVSDNSLSMRRFCGLESFRVGAAAKFDGRTFFHQKLRLRRMLSAGTPVRCNLQQ